MRALDYKAKDTEILQHESELSKSMNAILVDKALKVIGSPQKLVNLIGRRVYQLSGARPKSPPLIDVPQGLQEIDIALEEIIQGKITYESYEDEESQRIQNEPQPDRFG